jgi:hypothetical protein
MSHRLQGRFYSREFPVPDRATAKRYMLDAIPPGFWRRVRAKARRQGVSMRALILSLLTDWLADEVEDVERKAS